MKKILACFGATLLITGCFLPLLSTPDRSFNFFDTIPLNIQEIPPNTLQFAGIFITAIAILSIILAFTNKSKFLWIGGAATCTIIACMYFDIYSKLNEMKNQTNKQLDTLFGGMFKGLTDTLFQSVQLGGYGWYVIATGGAILIISSLPFAHK